MDGTVKVNTSVEVNTSVDRWQKDELAKMWKKFTGKEEKPVDQSPDRGSGWMK